MDDDDKAKLAKQGMRAADLVQPGRVEERVKESVADAASSVALRGLAAVGRLTSNDRSPARSRAVAVVDLAPSFAAFDADDAASFEQRLRRAVAVKAKRNVQSRRMDLADLRSSFPEASRELALLLFNCVDLLEDLSTDAEGEPASPAELERKEKLLTRIAELLAPRSGEALLSFVAHVVEISRRYRAPKDE